MPSRQVRLVCVIHVPPGAEAWPPSLEAWPWGLRGVAMGSEAWSWGLRGVATRLGGVVPWHAQSCSRLQPVLPPG